MPTVSYHEQRAPVPTRVKPSPEFQVLHEQAESTLYCEGFALGLLGALTSVTSTSWYVL